MQFRPRKYKHHRRSTSHPLFFRWVHLRPQAPPLRLRGGQRWKGKWRDNRNMLASHSSRCTRPRTVSLVHLPHSRLASLSQLCPHSSFSNLNCEVSTILRQNRVWVRSCAWICPTRLPPRRRFQHVHVLVLRQIMSLSCYCVAHPVLCWPPAVTDSSMMSPVFSTAQRCSCSRTAWGQR